MTANPKKILFVITKSNWGGAQRYVYDLATNLPKERFDAAVALGGKGLLTDRLAQAGIRTVAIAGLQRDLSFTKEIMSFFSLLSLFKKERPDIVHLNSSKAGALGALAARMQGIPLIVFTAHGWPFQEKRNTIWRLFVFFGSWMTALFAHRIICVSDNDLSLARQLPGVGRKAVRIYNGIDLHASLSSGEKIRSAFPTHARITGTVGELTANKNQQELIEEARKTPTMYVAIVGEGEERKTLEEKIQRYGLQERVKLFGFLPAQEVLKGFDVFSLPSKKEGLPYVLLEAKAAGLPILANRVGGVGEILDKDLNEFSLAKMLAQTEALYDQKS